MDNITKTTNTPEEIRAYALQGHCLCESCDAIRRAELSPAELAKAMLPAADISKLAARES
jgi:hypothetical protein